MDVSFACGCDNLSSGGGKALDVAQCQKGEKLRGLII